MIINPNDVNTKCFFVVIDGLVLYDDGRNNRWW